MSSSEGTAASGRAVVLAKPALGLIIDRLWREGYTVVGPTIAQGAIVFDELRTLDQLPIGWTDEQEGGTYRLKHRGDGAYFGYAVGPHSWKKYLFPSRLTAVLDRGHASARSPSIPARSPSPDMPSWGSDRATCTPSRSRTGSSCRGLMSTRITGRVGSPRS